MESKGDSKGSAAAAAAPRQLKRDPALWSNADVLVHLVGVQAMYRDVDLSAARVAGVLGKAAASLCGADLFATHSRESLQASLLIGAPDEVRVEDCVSRLFRVKATFDKGAPPARSCVSFIASCPCLQRPSLSS
jgi:hypothetical protein